MKSCPLCKSTDISVVSFGFWKVCAQCNTCGCSTDYMRDEKEAEEAWDTRPIEEELSLALSGILIMIRHYSGNSGLLIERIVDQIEDCLQKNNLAESNCGAPRVDVSPSTLSNQERLQRLQIEELKNELSAVRLLKEQYRKCLIEIREFKGNNPFVSRGDFDYILDLVIATLENK